MSGDRAALLIACGTHDSPTLRTLRSPAQDVAGLAEVLGAPGIGGFQVETLTDAPSHRVTRALERFFHGRGRDDTLLLHLSCHGLKDDGGRLHFASADTDTDLLASTTVPAAFVQAQMDRCRARTVVVLLDCCFSGAFLAGAKSDGSVHLHDELAGHGRVVLTATNRTEYAWEGEHVESLAPQFSRFTGALVEGLRSGAADLDGDGRVSVTELYDYVYETLRRGGAKQTPRMWADVEYRVVVASVPAGPRGHRGPRPAPAAEPEASRAPGPAPGPGTGPAPGPRTAGAESRSRSEAAGGPPARPARRARRGQDALIRVELPLEECAFGTVKDITVDTAVRCADCEGGSADPAGAQALCEACGGDGGQAAEPCDSCDGLGTCYLAPCPTCRGAGRRRTRRTLHLKIPAGVDDGTRIQLAGEGDVGPGGGPPGDLYVEIGEVPHARYPRHGDDLHAKDRVPRRLLDTGGTLSVDTLDGPRTLRVSPGHRAGNALRLRGLGMRHLRSEGRGDLFVSLSPDPAGRGGDLRASLLRGFGRPSDDSPGKP